MLRKRFFVMLCLPCLEKSYKIGLNSVGGSGFSDKQFHAINYKRDMPHLGLQYWILRIYSGFYIDSGDWHWLRKKLLCEWTSNDSEQPESILFCICSKLWICISDFFPWYSPMVFVGQDLHHILNFQLHHRCVDAFPLHILWVRKWKKNMLRAIMLSVALASITIWELWKMMVVWDIHGLEPMVMDLGLK